MSYQSIANEKLVNDMFWKIRRHFEAGARVMGIDPLSYNLSKEFPHQLHPIINGFCDIQMQGAEMPKHGGEYSPEEYQATTAQKVDLHDP